MKHFLSIFLFSLFPLQAMQQNTYAPPSPEELTRLYKENSELEALHKKVWSDLIHTCVKKSIDYEEYFNGSNGFIMRGTEDIKNMLKNALDNGIILGPEIKTTSIELQRKNGHKRAIQASLMKTAIVNEDKDFFNLLMAQEVPFDSTDQEYLLEMISHRVNKSKARTHEDTESSANLLDILATTQRLALIRDANLKKEAAISWKENVSQKKTDTLEYINRH
jgi:hypothetical protein